MTDTRLDSLFGTQEIVSRTGAAPPEYVGHVETTLAHLQRNPGRPQTSCDPLTIGRKRVPWHTRCAWVVHNVCI